MAGSTSFNGLAVMMFSITMFALFSCLIPTASGADCFGVANGTATLDACGVCGGNNQSCCLNFLGLDNSIWDWLLLRTAIDDLIAKLLDLSFLLSCASSNIPSLSTNCTNQDAALALFKSQIKTLQLADVIDTNNAFLTRCLFNFNSQVATWACSLDPGNCCLSV
eukprot:TRINITY_DN4271_c0_g1_i1.p1 TRINITY_DN4271_c0_g1~~TRINITY_DN4271_c0_g1_i1.p1  ORF type:complete len:165 (+),score=37.84 TRINITY_DN4271_c0_g1_i1:133-627(+)